MSIVSRSSVAPQTDTQGAVARIYTSLGAAVGAQLTVAEVAVDTGKSTGIHYHKRTEEVYVILCGTGRMRLDDEVRNVGPGDCVVIAPGVVHQISNQEDERLTFIAACAPAVDPSDFYSPDGHVEPLSLDS
jgi:mannose-6-phosphate isomerase-like protein (cupin superfamily)